MFDIRFAGRADRLDWDLEAMGQTGTVGSKRIEAWAVGARGGYTFPNLAWRPRIGLQVDAASGDRRPGDNRIETFNPLFPNGYYFTLAGYTGYVNLIYGQIRADYVFGPNLAGAVELVHYEVGDVIRRAGGHGSSYAGIELRFAW